MSTPKEITQINQLSDDIKGIKGDVKALQTTTTSIVYDNDRIIKPALESIQQTLRDGVYVTQKDFVAYAEKVDKMDDRTKNSALVEKIVFGLVGMIILAVGGALIALVVNQGGN